MKNFQSKLTGNLEKCGVGLGSVGLVRVTAFSQIGDGPNRGCLVLFMMVHGVWFGWWLFCSWAELSVPVRDIISLFSFSKRLIIQLYLCIKLLHFHPAFGLLFVTKCV